MNISQEILVLDFGDENKNSVYLRSDANADFNEKTVTIIEPCTTKTSVLALAITCALMVLLYIATMSVYLTWKWMQPHKIVKGAAGDTAMVAGGGGYMCFGGT